MAARWTASLATTCERLAAAAGVVTLVIGAALTGAPLRTSSALALGASPVGARVLGLADLALAPGLLRGRPRWPWMAGRALLNVVVAQRFSAASRRAGGDTRSRRGAAAMSTLAVVDGGAAMVLWRSRR